MRPRQAGGRAHTIFRRQRFGASLCPCFTNFECVFSETNMHEGPKLTSLNTIWPPETPQLHPCTPLRR